MDPFDFESRNKNQTFFSFFGEKESARALESECMCLCASVCVRVCVRERERENEKNGPSQTRSQKCPIDVIIMFDIKIKIGILSNGTTSSMKNQWRLKNRSSKKSLVANYVFRQDCNLAIWQFYVFGDLAIWPYYNLAISRMGNITIWQVYY